MKFNDYEREICREIINCALELKKLDMLYKENSEPLNFLNYVAEAAETYGYFAKALKKLDGVE